MKKSDADSVQQLEPLPIVMAIDALKPPHLTGWATTLSEGAHNIFALIDGTTIESLSCSLFRKDLVGSEFPQDCGFSLEIPDCWLDGRPHTIEFRTPARPGERMKFIHDGRQKSSLILMDIIKPIFHSMVDDISGQAIVGWVLRETKDGKFGDQTVLVTSDDEPIAQVKANRNRPDVAKHFESDAFCGFRFVAPMSMRRSSKQVFRFYLLPERVELDGSPFTVQLLNNTQQRKLIELTETVERLETTMMQARHLIDGLQPTLVFALDDYHEWTAQYREYLRECRYPLDDQPLVSIICPTFRPNYDHFAIALDSVCTQSYKNWQLIVVDDGNHNPDLTNFLAHYHEMDTRIQIVRSARNEGISAATVRGLKKATGEWVAFLDHDDILVDRAIEIMVSEAQRTGAEMLYSDEDKIDEVGTFTQPHFKPNWNYRYLLCCNYVCHLLMVKRTRIQTTHFDSVYDGAQDHHLILALSESLVPREIHHVPEVLYHWRITPNSTAESVQNKPGVGMAGVAAIRAHLMRRGLSADVTSMGSKYGAFYQQRWRVTESPKVAIIIPFKNNAAMTRQCLEALDITVYPNYEIILVDNWSTERETLMLLKEMEQRDDVRIVRVEEPFNYSRLNNIACQTTDAACFLFLNNDVVHEGAQWLRWMVDEMVIDDSVAVVGAKLLYPNDLVQHAGVVLGIGRVADHAHHLLGAAEPGYSGRAMVAQELSAVTGACMLVRASAFNEMGGFDEELAVAYNDVDLCIRLTNADYKVVFAPDVVAEHHESLSRGLDDKPLSRKRFQREARLMQTRWKDKLNSDPHYSRHFDLDHEAYSVLKSVPLIAQRKNRMVRMKGRDGFKWYFALSEASLYGNTYADCIRVAVRTALSNTRLRPVFIFDGGENRFLDELRQQGVEVIKHRSSLFDTIVATKPNDPHFIRTGAGAFLRLEVPIIEQDDDYILYTDCDVMFLSDPNLHAQRPRFFSAAPEFEQGDYANMNSGVIVMNVPSMRACYAELIDFVKTTGIGPGTYDQGALRSFFKGRYDHLPETLNWKPYWGKNSQAEILHFHGPKPPHVRTILSGEHNGIPSIYLDLYQKDEGFYREAIDQWYAILG